MTAPSDDINLLKTSALEVPVRRQPSKRFYCMDNEGSELFLPIIGSHAFAVYSSLLQRAFAGASMKYTVRGMAKATSLSRATAWREILVLQRIGMVRLRSGGGNRESTCEFTDLKELARAC